MRTRTMLHAAAVLGTVAAPVSAQEASLFLGGIRTEYADTVAGSAATAGARLWHQSPRLWGVVQGGFTQFTSGTWAAQMSGALATVYGLGASTGMGLRFDGDYGYLEGGTWSGLAAGGPFVLVAPDGWLLTAGVTAGAVRHIDGTSDPLVMGGLRAGRVLGHWGFETRATTTLSDTIRFTDFTLALDFRTARLALSASGGFRSGDYEDDPWIQGLAEWRVAPIAALEAQIGTYPRDLAGFEHGFFASVGVRLLGSSPRSRGGSAAAPLAVEPISPTEARITVVVPDAQAVAIAGDWNAWAPVPLSPAGKRRWQIVLPLGPGAYRFALIAGGDRWFVPDGVPKMPDEFGGEVGLLVVGAR